MSPARTAAALVVLALGGSARARGHAAPSGGDGLAELWRRVDQEISRAAAELAPRPPVPTAVRWHPRRLAAIDLGSPLLALGGGDLDGDGKDELVALTKDEVLVLARGKQPLAIAARLALGGERAARPPRDPVGSLALVDREGDGRLEIVARSSARAQAVVLDWRQRSLVELGREDGFPLCGGSAELVAGRNLFRGDGAHTASAAQVDLPAAFYGAACYDGLVDAEGRAIRVAAVLDEQASLSVRCRRAGAACAEAAARRFDDAGTAFLVADVDTDGQPEVVITRDAAPGEPDSVTVYGQKGEQERRLFSRSFNGGVAAIAAADLGGDGTHEVVVAVRLYGSNQVNLWALD